MKRTLYPKTKRISNSNKITITEKLDGSNLGFFNVEGSLVIAQRNHIFKLSGLEEVKAKLYKGLYQWLLDNGHTLQAELRHGSGIFGEWLGMGKLKYADLGRFYMFAKANIDNEFNAYNIYYDRDLFQYPFLSLKTPDCIGIVPEVCQTNSIPSIKELDDIYDLYCTKLGRSVEGFVISIDQTNVLKYVRMKNGKLSAHKE